MDRVEIMCCSDDDITPEIEALADALREVYEVVYRVYGGFVRERRIEMPAVRMPESGYIAKGVKDVVLALNVLKP